jgi:hypothetical protein
MSYTYQCPQHGRTDQVEPCCLNAVCLTPAFLREEAKAAAHTLRDRYPRDRAVKIMCAYMTTTKPAPLPEVSPALLLKAWFDNYGYLLGNNVAASDFKLLQELSGRWADVDSLAPTFDSTDRLLGEKQEG